MAKFWLLVACKRYWGDYSGGFLMELVQKNIVPVVTTCLGFFPALFIYCGTFLVGVHVCFGTYCSASYETLAMVHKCTYPCNFLPSIELMH